MAVVMGEQPFACAAYILRRHAAVQQTQTVEFVQALVDLADERAARARHDDMIGRAPAQLLGDLVAERLGAVAIEGAQIDIDERPAVLAARLGAQAVHLVVIAGDGEDVRAVDQRAQHFALLQVGRNEDIGLEAAFGGVRGDGVGEVAGGGAGDGIVAELARFGQGAARPRDP